MNESLAGKLELTALRARRLLGSISSVPGDSRSESTEGSEGPPGDRDAAKLAEQLLRISPPDPENPAALADAAASAQELAKHIIAVANAALVKVKNAGSAAADLTDEDALALESVIHIRGRPAIRVEGARLESLQHHPGAELWESFVTDHEDAMIVAASATGAVFVNSFASGFPPWVQGSAWLTTPHRVVTNRHVLLDSNRKLVGPTDDGKGLRFLDDYKLSIDFSHDNRTPAAKTRHMVKSVVYLAPENDPVDIAVLEIEPSTDRTPLAFAASTATLPANLFVVGHPGAMQKIPDSVKAVFAQLDSRKRVSFGKRLDASGLGNHFAHDASTVGGYSGGPVVKITGSEVSGLHYYGDPTAGNLAVSAAAIRAHPAFPYLTATTP